MDNTEWVHEATGTRITFWDTYSTESYERLRPLVYPGAHAFWICFGLSDRASWAAVRSKWIPELQHHCPSTPYILVGCKLDLIHDDTFLEAHPRAHQSVFVSEEEIRLFAAEVSAPFHLTSAKSNIHLQELLNATVGDAGRAARNINAPSSSKCCLL